MNNKQNAQHKKQAKNYYPLLSLIIISILAAFTLQLSLDLGFMFWMHYFMGTFLLFFATLKIFNLKGFADGFEMYDLLAKKTRGYAYLYPFIELFLALAYLGIFAPIFTYSLTIVVMFFGAIGVILALRKGLDINCPCMGSILEVPLSTVTLTEDLLMGLMGVMMLILT